MDPHYVQVRAWHRNGWPMLRVRARSLLSAHPHCIRVRALRLSQRQMLDPHFVLVRA